MMKLQDFLDEFLKMPKGDQQKALKMIQSAMAGEPEENIGPPPIPEGPGKPPVGP